MVDLHMHTSSSDGQLTVEKLRKRIEKLNLTKYSITDHNHALAYELFDYKSDKRLICGTEITTSYRGVIVEVLMYNIEPKIINEWYYQNYSEEKLLEIETLLFNDLYNILTSLGYDFGSNYELQKIEKGYAKKQLYYDLISRYPDFEYKTYKKFFRQGLSNPQSPYFIDEGRTYPSLKEVKELGRKTNGITILAHPYEYGLPIKELEQLVLDFELDGMEAFHPSASQRESIQILDFCEKNKLKSSMGSDFHKDERLVPLGVHVHKEIWNYSCLDWINVKE